MSSTGSANTANCIDSQIISEQVAANGPSPLQCSDESHIQVYCSGPNVKVKCLVSHMDYKHMEFSV